MIATDDIAQVLAELKALREEEAELKQTMHLLEHKPNPVPPDTLETVPLPELLPWCRRSIFSLKV